MSPVAHSAATGAFIKLSRRDIAVKKMERCASIELAPYQILRCTRVGYERKPVAKRDIVSRLRDNSAPCQPCGSRTVRYR